MGMKIDGSSSRTGSVSGQLQAENKKIEEKGASQFHSQLRRQASGDQEEMMQRMAKEIVKQGERLTEKVDIAELKAYKRMISEFLEEAVQGFAKFSKENYMDRRGRHRLYATVKKVNKNLEELTEEVLNSERDHLKIAGKIEDIRGLILDIIL